MIINVKPFECKRLTSEFVRPLMNFLHSLEENGDDEFFHPHPFTVDIIETLARQEGRNLYYIFTEGESIVGYAMLRGWDEGYEIPSLGIVIHPAFRRAGLGQLFINFLHVVARRRGSKKVRLRVCIHNEKAIQLYKKMGYQFQSTPDEGYIVAYFSL